MMKKNINIKTSFIVLTAAAMLLVSGCAAASGAVQQIVPAPETERTITVLGEGTAYGASDRVSLQVGVETIGETVVLATNQNEDIMTALFTALEKEGVLREDIQTSNYSVWTESYYGEGGFQSISGYRVNNQLSIMVRELDSLSRILQAAMDAGANNIYGVSFDTSQPRDLKSEARQLAFENAEEIAAELAALSGLEIVSVVEITEMASYSAYPDYAQPQMGGAGDAAAPSIAPGMVSRTVQVQVTYLVK